MFNTDTSQGLQNTEFFYVGKVCCLHGGQKQRQLKISQFVRYTNPEWYVYKKHGLKNRNIGFYQLSVQNKNAEIQKNLNDKKQLLVTFILQIFHRLLRPKICFTAGH